ncbi:MAG: hypothetical protein EZS28_039951 [Streblomastix strix]|uniref:Uncharacterized protein n=1 Tax=Streblomastix strix TaxID=222440 RepID=A0A5J4U3L3_9EUKA|nr:MAG: hypothetical protein EZS28_039951 [Streblomastix strix]
MGFVFTSFPEELQPFSKHVLLLGDDGSHKQSIMGYISEKGFYIGSSIGNVDQITSIKGNTHIAIAGVYYTDYEPLKRAISDVNGDGKINIVDDWHVNSIIDEMKSMSEVQDVTSYTSFAGMIQINGNDTPDIVVNQGIGQYPMDLCDFSGSYLIDPQEQESKQNNITSNGQPISHIDNVIIQHDTLPSVPITPSVFPQYTVTEVSRDQLLALAYTPYNLDIFKIYIIDDTVIKLVMFNMHLRQKGFIEIKQYVLNIPSAYLTVSDTDNPVRWHIHTQSVLKADNKGLQASSRGLDAIYANNAQDRIMNLANFRNGVGNFIDEPKVRQSIENNRHIRLNPNVSRNISRTIGSHLAIPNG